MYNKESAQIVEQSLEFEKLLDKIQEESHQKARKKFLMSTLKKLTIEQKEQIALQRIKEFFERCDKAKLTPVVSFSGGKDSCVVRHLVSRVRKGIKLETAAELFHPEIAKFLNQIPKDEITFYQPLVPFEKLVKEEGYPILLKEVAQKIHNVRNTKILGNWVKACFGLRNSRQIPKKYLHFIDKRIIKYNVSNKCCSLIKGTVKSSKAPKFVGTTIEESELRRTNWLRHGCNYYKKNSWASRPISLFTEKDVWDYIKKHDVPYSKAYGNYGDRWQRTGCVCCGFGLSLEQARSKKGLGRSRIELLYDYYPHTYHYYIHEVGLIEPFCDAGIDLNVDDQVYRKKFEQRQEIIKRWYLPDNFKYNLEFIIRQVEQQTNDKFSSSEIEQIFENYRVTK